MVKEFTLFLLHTTYSVVVVCSVHSSIYNSHIFFENSYRVSPTAKKSQTFLSIHPTFFGMLLKHLWNGSIFSRRVQSAKLCVEIHKNVWSLRRLTVKTDTNQIPGKNSCSFLPYISYFYHDRYRMNIWRKATLKIKLLTIGICRPDKISSFATMCGRHVRSLALETFTWNCVFFWVGVVTTWHQQLS